MYRKRNRSQLTLDDFILPFGGKLKAENRWVKLAQMIPWDYVEDIYAKSMCGDNGAGAISSRIAFGAIFIKEHENLTDQGTVGYIAENPYMQYFLGLHEYDQEPLFDASMMVHFRKRYPADMVRAINKRMFAGCSAKGGDGDDKGSGGEGGTQGGEANEVIPEDEQPVQNLGKLILDATCAPSDIRYPTDISLLNEARENTEELIDKLWGHGPGQGRKTRYHRRKARSEYLGIAKQKKPRYRKINAAIRGQLQYVKSNIDTLGQLLMRVGTDLLSGRELERLAVICAVHRQQSLMYQSGERKCGNRIVSLRQPHIRPILRGKAGNECEFGQKISLSVVSGYTFIERQSYNNFNEGAGLIACVEGYRDTYGYYPEAILVDKIYRNRTNLNYCKGRNIRLSGPKLGRPGKDAGRDRKIEYSDMCARNIVEGRSGTAKRRFGLDLIMAYLPETGMTEAALQILCMNTRIRLLFLAIRKWVEKRFCVHIFVHCYAVNSCH